MKKSILFLAIIACVSCKKTHTCECTITYPTGVGNGTYSQSATETIKDTKRHAKKTCEAKSGDVFTNVPQTCVLKN